MALSIFFEVKAFLTSKDLRDAVDRDEPMPRLLVSDLLLEENQLLVDLLEEPQFQTILKKSQILVLSGNPRKTSSQGFLKKEFWTLSASQRISTS